MVTQVWSKYIGLLIVSATFTVHKNSICDATCFTRRLNCQQKDECCCDEPSLQTTFNDISSSRAFVSCTWTCSNNSHCLAFNFNENSKICKIFYDEPLRCFQNIDGCHHMYLPEAVIRNLTIGADDRIVALYFDGVPQQRMPNWSTYNRYDSYIVPFHIQVIAIHAHNSITGSELHSSLNPLLNIHLNVG
ncbi:hypothetical protein HELRODRAFT_174093 [Helobdella robusta]|uniref:Apple domain-containing protein n=1 Tax=Helobdella robusta TaxID=6412 RepID=T1F7L4_HELRO|nr:hypothetical protein HELRODRAFT_174093 [Helobdella robusta]ESO03193.1 hypothetical protein HELRODRAFT_174093 [Helobdella robusta]